MRGFSLHPDPQPSWRWGDTGRWEVTALGLRVLMGLFERMRPMEGLESKPNHVQRRTHGHTCRPDWCEPTQVLTSVATKLEWTKDAMQHAGRIMRLACQLGSGSSLLAGDLA